MLIYALSVLDRYIVATLVEPIKAEFGLSDGQIGFLTGMAYAVAYAVCGIPIARLADRTVRIRLISILLAFWSAMTAAAGAATAYWQLVLARAGVGAGESGLVPTAHSLIADLFKPEHRASAIGVFTFGGVIGGSTAFYVGGWMAETYGWRITLFAAAAPGFLLALLFLLLKEPPREARADEPAAANATRALLPALGALFASRQYTRTVVAFAIFAFVSIAVFYWAPAFMVRSGGFGLAEAGRFLGVAAVFGGIGGILFLTTLASRLLRSDVRYHLWIPSAMISVFFCSAMLVLLAPSPTTAYLLFLAEFAAYATAPPLFAYILSLARPDQRALAASVNVVLLSIVGIGFGPQAAGWMSDALRPLFEHQSLAYGLAILCLSCPVAIMLLIYNGFRETRTEVS